MIYEVMQAKKPVGFWSRLAAFFCCLWNWLCRRGWVCNTSAVADKKAEDGPVEKKDQAIIQTTQAVEPPKPELPVQANAEKLPEKSPPPIVLEPLKTDEPKTANPQSPVRVTFATDAMMSQIKESANLHEDELSNKKAWFVPSENRYMKEFEFKKEVAEVSNLANQSFNPLDFSLIFTDKAWNALNAFIQVCPEEVSGLGIVERLDLENPNKFYVTEIFLPRQRCTAASTDMSQYITSLQNDLMECGRRHDIKKLKFWWHSHHEMGTSPSPQDERQMQEFNTGTVEYMIRGIFNKRNEGHITLFDYKRNLKLVKHVYGIVCPVSPRVLNEAKEQVSRKVF
jgi:hypothetical protein